LGTSIDDPPLVVTSRAALMACVKAGLGLTVVPLLTRAEKAMGLTFIPLNNPRMTRTIGIMTRRGQTPLPTVARMKEMMRDSLRAYAYAQGATVVTARPRRRAHFSKV
jgi:DNA-binding transcriptional LysR family regulator